MADFMSRFNEISVRHPGNDTSLGAALGVSKQTISAWRTGARSPKKPHIVAIAEYFNVSIPYLMGWSDDPNYAGTTSDLIASTIGSDSPAAQKLQEIKSQFKSPMIGEMVTAMQRMTLKEQKKMVDMGKVLFPDRFKEED